MFENKIVNFVSKLLLNIALAIKPNVEILKFAKHCSLRKRQIKEDKPRSLRFKIKLKLISFLDTSEMKYLIFEESYKIKCFFWQHTPI